MTPIPKHDDALELTDRTDLDDVLAFVARRLESPAVLRDGDLVVWNFNNHAIDGTALINAADGLDGHYTIPYQVPGVWGFIIETLPDRIANAPLLTYRVNEGRYKAYHNWRGDLYSAEFDEMRARFGELAHSSLEVQPEEAEP